VRLTRHPSAQCSWCTESATLQAILANDEPLDACEQHGPNLLERVALELQFDRKTARRIGDAAQPGRHDSPSSSRPED
jgi:hypothetical protein